MMRATRWLMAAAAGLTLGAAAADDTADFDVHIGQSYIYQSPQPVSRVLVSDSDIAQVQLLEEGQVQVLGRALGSTDVWLWYRGKPDQPVRFPVAVHQDLSGLMERIAEVMGPTDTVRATTLNNRLVLDGTVPDTQTRDQLAALAAIYDPEFVNQLELAADQQVQLRVVFAEVNRTRLRQMGLEALWSDGGLLTSTELGVGLLPPALGTDAFQILGTLTEPFALSALLSVLEQNSLSQTLARPTLVVLSGQEADFLAGGEVPIPVAQYGERVSIEYREYGVKVHFLPTVLRDDVIDLGVYVEVSDVDPTNTVTLAEIEVPALTSRKSESHVRLADGMTFAMAGMLDESVQATVSKIPLLGDIPLLGALFRRVDHEQQEIEILILVTPELVRPLGQDELPALPGADRDPVPNGFELYGLGKLYHGRAKSAPVEDGGMEQ